MRLACQYQGFFYTALRYTSKYNQIVQQSGVYQKVLTNYN